MDLFSIQEYIVEFIVVLGIYNFELWEKGAITEQDMEELHLAMNKEKLSKREANRLIHLSLQSETKTRMCIMIG